MTQVEVANGAGLNDKYYGKIERDESSPTIDKLEQISFSLGVSMQQIVNFKLLEPVLLDADNDDGEQFFNGMAYCNCCGTDFELNKRKVVCTECGCEFSEMHNYIEIFKS